VTSSPLLLLICKSLERVQPITSAERQTRHRERERETDREMSEDEKEEERSAAGD
jgi:hypothetical protein